LQRRFLGCCDRHLDNLPKMKVYASPIWVWIATIYATYEALASQNGSVTLGERIAGAMPSLVLLAALPVLLLLGVWLTYRSIQRGATKLLCLGGYLHTTGASSRSKESRKILVAIANSISHTRSVATTDFTIEGDLPHCQQSGGELSLNHSMPLFREYSVWIACTSESIREIRVVRVAQRIIVLSVFTTSANHIDAFKNRNEIVVPLTGRQKLTTPFQ
jgi:hypothetical protein